MPRLYFVVAVAGLTFRGWHMQRIGLSQRWILRFVVVDLVLLLVWIHARRRLWYLHCLHCGGGGLRNLNMFLLSIRTGVM